MNMMPCKCGLKPNSDRQDYFYCDDCKTERHSLEDWNAIHMKFYRDLQDTFSAAIMAGIVSSQKSLSSLNEEFLEQAAVKSVLAADLLIRERNKPS